MPTKPKISEHGGELILLSLIAVGVLVLIGGMVWASVAKGQATNATLGDVSPFLLIEQSIIGAIKDRWNARLQGQSNQLLGAATPAGDPSAADRVAGRDPLDLAGAELPKR